MKLLQKILLSLILILSLIGVTPAQEYKPSAMAKHNEGIEYYNHGDYNAAIKCFKKAIEIDSNFVDAYYNLGILYEFTSNQKEAIMAFKNLLTRNPEDYEAAYKIAQLYYDKGNLKTSLNYIHLVDKSSSLYPKAQELNKKIIAGINEANLRQKQEILKSQGKKSDSLLLDTPQRSVLGSTDAPTGITKDNQGNIYIASFSRNSITQINPKGENKLVFKGVPLNGPIGLVMDSFYNLYAACYNSGEIVRISPTGEAKVILNRLHKPYYMFIDSTNTLYVSEQGSNSVLKYKIY